MPIRNFLITKPNITMKKILLDDAKLLFAALNKAHECRTNPESVSDDLFNLIENENISDADLIPYLLSYATLLMGITASLHNRVSMRLDDIVERMDQSLDADDSDSVSEFKKIKKISIRTYRIHKRVRKLDSEIYENYNESI